MSAPEEQAKVIVNRVAEEVCEKHDVVVCTICVIIAVADALAAKDAEIEHIKTVEFPRRAENVTKTLRAERDQWAEIANSERLSSMDLEKERDHLKAENERLKELDRLGNIAGDQLKADNSMLKQRMAELERDNAFLVEALDAAISDSKYFEQKGKAAKIEGLREAREIIIATVRTKNYNATVDDIQSAIEAGLTAALEKGDKNEDHN